MWVKIMEVDGKPVKKRFSLGGALNYLEAGEIKEVDDAIGQTLCERNFCTVEEPPMQDVDELPVDAVTVAVADSFVNDFVDEVDENGPGEDEEESEVSNKEEPNY